MVGWYLYDFTAEVVYTVSARRTKQGRTCPGSEPFSRVGPLEKDQKDRMAASTERVKKETDHKGVD